MTLSGKVALVTGGRHRHRPRRLPRARPSRGTSGRRQLFSLPGGRRGDGA
jgi:hypothetical protein